MKTAFRILLIPIALMIVVATVVFSKGENPAKPIRFDHGLHVIENDMSCADCHVGVESLKAGERAIPDHSVCSDCHDAESDDECGVCHVNPENPVGTPPVGEFYAGFAHKAHTSVECSSCHSKLTSTGMQPKLPAMVDCQSCHLDRMGPVNCTDCHLGKKPVPMDHKLVSWSQDHGLDAGAGIVDCGSCHAQSSCDECHQGFNLFGNPHPVTWKFNHFAESAYGSECMSCHETRETCTSCHRKTLTMPHELGELWANKSNGGAHREEAEAFIEVCLSCHDVGESDPTCAKCHE